LDENPLTLAPSLERAFSFPNVTEDASDIRAEFSLNPGEIKVVVMGKEGFSASPVSITNFLKEAGFQGTSYCAKIIVCKAEFVDTDNPVTTLKNHPDRSKIHCVICPFAQSGKIPGLKILEYLRKTVKCPIVSKFNCCLWPLISNK
jgi:hypothetical protein